MWESIEREFDGMVGRMLSWLTHPPVEASGDLEAPGDLEEPVEALSAPVTETVRTSSWLTHPPAQPPAGSTAGVGAAEEPAQADMLDAFVNAVEPATEPLAGGAASEVSENLERFVEAAERAFDETNDLEKKVLAVLAASPRGASVAELQNKTGGQLAALRPLMNRLLESGRLLRGKGIRTRYHRVVK